MTGSSLPRRASWVRSRLYFASASYCASWVLAGDALRAANRCQRLHHGIVVDAVAGQQLADAAALAGAIAISRCSVEV